MKRLKRMGKINSKCGRGSGNVNSRVFFLHNYELWTLLNKQQKNLKYVDLFGSQVTLVMKLTHLCMHSDGRWTGTSLACRQCRPGDRPPRSGGHVRPPNFKLCLDKIGVFQYFGWRPNI